MRAALVRRHGVDLVDDHRARGRQHRAAGIGAEQDVERLRRGDEDMRRPPAHARRARPAACRRCAPRCGSRHRAGRARAAPRGCRPAAPPGCAGCRWTAPSAARRRPPAWRRRGCLPGPGAPARRSPPETPPASCRSRSARRSGVSRPAWIAGQACACAGVGRRKAAGEPRRDGGVKHACRAHLASRIRGANRIRAIIDRGHCGRISESAVCGPWHRTQPGRPTPLSTNCVIAATTPMPSVWRSS